ncbi:plasma membrane ca+ atpase isoform [Echinococcus multilocularis]|uniref:Plasma membrane ca+ atpase isoform n=1 Tax=Echinococcus multilocularis TaxID=6211 RepID=A0A0S4MM06_ECHMU|nr:plasma membrane ca+ atpase isoform [Echinococcus multilocularis]
MMFSVQRKFAWIGGVPLEIAFLLCVNVRCLNIYGDLVRLRNRNSWQSRAAVFAWIGLNGNYLQLGAALRPPLLATL